MLQAAKLVDFGIKAIPMTTPTTLSPGATSCLIVGAGLSGLLAAQQLQNAGLHVTVLEAAGRVGGRLASHTLTLPAARDAVFDHGAQYFTVRSNRFRQTVEKWLQAGVVHQWSTGFATPDASTYRDGHARYRGHPHMMSIAAHLAGRLDVRLDTPITAARFTDHWSLLAEQGSHFKGDTLILTPPAPQSLALIDDGDISLSSETRASLSRIKYDPCLALLVALDGPSNVPKPGGLWPGIRAISWLADNAQKGISTVPCLTIHGSPEFSRDYFDAPEEEVARLLLAESERWLGANVIGRHLVRWRYSIPINVYSQPTLFCSSPGPLAFAGDAFAGPRVEGAALSGLAAAAAILRATTGD